MTKKIMDWFITELKLIEGLKQVEAYEGQFEDPEDVTIFPPAALVTFTQFTNTTEAMYPKMEYSASVFIVASHVHGKSQDSVLDTMDSIIDHLHNKAVRYDADTLPAPPPKVYLGRCFLTGGSFFGVLPGMVVYRLDFTLRG